MSLLGTMQTGQAGVHGARLAKVAGLREKIVYCGAEAYVTFNPTPLLISCVMSNKFLNLYECQFLHHKMGLIMLTL